MCGVVLCSAQLSARVESGRERGCRCHRRRGDEKGGKCVCVSVCVSRLNGGERRGKEAH